MQKGYVLWAIFAPWCSGGGPRPKRAVRSSSERRYEGEVDLFFRACVEASMSSPQATNLEATTPTIQDSKGYRVVGDLWPLARRRPANILTPRAASIHPSVQILCIPRGVFASKRVGVWVPSPLCRWKACEGFGLPGSRRIRPAATAILPAREADVLLLLPRVRCGNCGDDPGHLHKRNSSVMNYVTTRQRLHV